jgi:hypothetical protein
MEQGKQEQNRSNRNRKETNENIRNCKGNSISEGEQIPMKGMIRKHY